MTAPTPQPTPLTYNGYVTQVATMAVVPITTITNIGSNQIVVGNDITGAPSAANASSPFNSIIPQMLNYAELRIQRDLDLLPSLITNTSYSLASGANTLSLNTSDFITVQTVSVVSGTAAIPLIPTTKEFIQNVYNDSSSTGQPQYFAMSGGDPSSGGLNSNYVLFGPYSNANYPLSITGTVRLQSLFPGTGTDGYPITGTGTTFISTYLQDLLLQASMVYISQYQRNFGSASNDPSMGATYEMQYQSLLKGASVEEARKKFNSSGWSPLSPAPIAAIPR
jgi:hypothetical protein